MGDAHHTSHLLGFSTSLLPELGWELDKTPDIRSCNNILWFQFATMSEVHSRSLAHGSSCGRVSLRSSASYAYLAEYLWVVICPGK